MNRSIKFQECCRTASRQGYCREHFRQPCRNYPVSESFSLTNPQGGATALGVFHWNQANLYLSVSPDLGGRLKLVSGGAPVGPWLPQVHFLNPPTTRDNSVKQRTRSAVAKPGSGATGYLKESGKALFAFAARQSTACLPNRPILNEGLGFRLVKGFPTAVPIKSVSSESENNLRQNAQGNSKVGCLAYQPGTETIPIKAGTP